MIYNKYNYNKEKFNENDFVKFDKRTLVLASNSNTRFEIMQKSGLDFIVIPSLMDEEKLKEDFGKVNTKEKAIEYVKQLALAKAKWVNDYTENAIILGADTVAFYRDQILEKPKDEKDARRIFSLISDSTHSVITGVCIIDNENIYNFAKVSPIKFLTIPKELQDELVKDKLTYTYAGGYCIEGNLQGKSISKPEDFNNILGLPIEEIIIKLKELGYDFSK